MHFYEDIPWEETSICMQVQEFEEQRERELDKAALTADYMAASGLF